MRSGVGWGAQSGGGGQSMGAARAPESAAGWAGRTQCGRDKKGRQVG